MARICRTCKAVAGNDDAFCPKCGTDLAAPSALPAAPTENKPNTVGWCILIAVALVVVGWVNTTFFHGDEPTTDDRQTAAVEACRESVRAQLKAPGSADFSGERYFERADVYTVSGVVDAENSFGASLRSTWTCTATPIGDGERYTGTASVDS